MEKTNICISKEFFIETIEEIKKQMEHDDKCQKAFQVIMSDSYAGYYDNHYIHNQLLKLLKVFLHDNHRDSWIDYFIYDMDFGKQYYDGCVTEKDESIIDLSNASSLYDFLIKKINIKNEII